ncbi:hypothetical protein AAF712_011824 [Marasmius tenuissimus]|uniref:Steroid 5-alpha reductase C-terminal domain-containing protein n=1 Tax=Marasmius tenuissimus TaxID=585030 RepID=A0ABR2ZK30_9AGAR|nr:hypothetical protein PM082_016519 [Marasmius tenuissimus]
MSSSSADRQLEHAFIKRGTGASSLFTKLLFSISRIADVPLQYQILAHGLGHPIITALGSQPLGLPHPSAASPGSALTSFLGLSPYRSVLLGMSIVTMVKQVNWLVRISKEDIGVGGALGVGAFNMFTSSLNTLIFSAAATSVITTPADEWDLSSSPQLLVGAAIFAIGIALEWISEEQRKVFKDDPRNKGKVYSGGLFGWARHINFGGFVLWRTGFAIAAGGWWFGAAVATVFAWSFATSAIPELDDYCLNRYQAQWMEYKRKVPHKLIPFIY